MHCSIVTKSRSLVAWGWKVDEVINVKQKGITEGLDKILVCDGYINYIDFGNVFMGLC